MIKTQSQSSKRESKDARQAKEVVAATEVKPPKPPRDIKVVWVEYKKVRSEHLRNILMEHYLHLVRYNAERIHVK
jgi:hypothetical protein